jgi:hypothetical protein
MNKLIKNYDINIEYKATTSTNPVLSGRCRSPRSLCFAVFVSSSPLQFKFSANETSSLLFNNRTAIARERCTIAKKQTIDFLIISFI